LDFDLGSYLQWDVTTEKVKINWQKVEIAEADPFSQEIHFKYAYDAVNTYSTRLKKRGRSVNLNTVE